MSDNEHVAKAHQEIATRNSQTAVQISQETKTTTAERLDHMERLIMTLHEQLNNLDRKYNLLLTSRFNGGSTAE